MIQIKLINNWRTIEKDVNEFLAQLQDGQFIDIKYQKGDDWAAAMIIYNTEIKK